MREWGNGHGRNGREVGPLPVTGRPMTSALVADRFLIRSACLCSRHSHSHTAVSPTLQVSGLLLDYIRPEDRILMVGCGNSTFSADLVSRWYALDADSHSLWWVWRIPRPLLRTGEW